jgi:septum formation protein
MSVKSIFPFKVVLGSASPRRIELMRGLGVDITVKPSHADETYPQNLTAEQIPCFLAEQKMHAIAPSCNANDVILTADTIVYFKGKVFNKPKNEQEALTMLSALSENTHTVFTAVALKYQGYSNTFYDSADVHFTKLSLQELQFYISNYKPFDKAGSYGVQDWLGYIGIESVKGSFYTVMGLPVHKVYQELKHINSFWA